MEKLLQKQANSRYGWSEKQFSSAWCTLASLQPFNADENIFESGQHINEDVHKLLRLQVEYFISQALDAMLITKDDNLKDTAKRIAKVWCGDGLECDDELGGGRFSKPVRVPRFPNTRGADKWITKEVRIVATCSHHFLPFTGTAKISYKPNKFVLGISKLQRLTNYVANRFWLQEDLTREIHRIIVREADVSDADVKVEIVAQHSCEKDRGVKNTDCNFYTEE